MNKNTLKNFAAVALILSASMQGTVFANAHTSIVKTSLVTKMKIGIEGAALKLSLAAKKRYDWVQSYIDDIVADITADYLRLVITPNKALTEKEVRKKGWLIGIRKRVFIKLEGVVKKNSPALSKGHKDKIESYLGTAETVLWWVDALSQVNPYEQKYAKASFIDSFIEDQIVSSIIFGLKPEEECSLKELEKKKQDRESSKKMLHKLHDKTKADPLLVRASSSIIDLLT